LIIEIVKKVIFIKVISHKKYTHTHTHTHTHTNPIFNTYDITEILKRYIQDVRQVGENLKSNSKIKK